MGEIASTQVFIDRYHPQKDGRCAVSIRVTNNRKRQYFPTTIRLTVAEFEKLLKGERVHTELKNTWLTLQALEKKAGDIISKMPLFTWEAFEKQFRPNRGSRNNITTAFEDYEAALREQGRIGTAVSYGCARASLDKFKKDAVFADVTPAFLQRYEKWMKDNGNSITTVGIYLRSLRTIFNNVIADGLISKELYPFGKRRYEIPASNNIKKALSLEDIAKIYSYKPYSREQARARDLWLFMYFCNGINVKDLCLLKYKNMHRNMIVFERAKTARSKRVVEPVRVPLLDESRDIIQKWGNEPATEDTYIFPVLSEALSPERERQLVQQLTQWINDYMKAIAKELGLTAAVTTYAARHSFATVLKRSGASTEFISEALGHSNIRTTQNYLASFEDESKIEMSKVLIAFKRSKEHQR